MSSLLTDNSKKILDMRYVDKEHDKTVDGMWDRVSMGNPDYLRLLKELIFLPNSPTIMNLGLPFGGTCSACFVFDLEDTLAGDWPEGGPGQEPFVNSILGTRLKAALVAKAGGGVGYYLGKIRPRNAHIRSTHKKACGPVIVLRDLNFLRTLITQGGKRDLAQMGVLDATHPDIREFIHVKDIDPQGLGSFNISVSWRNDWLKKVMGNLPYWDSCDPSEPVHLWTEQCESAWKSGCPGMLFWDTINAANATPHLGDINATNPCGETPNINDEPCNLGSIAVCRFVRGTGKTARFDWGVFKHAVRASIRFMDDILDQNKFPHPNIHNMAHQTRKLGLGVMGWADTLALMHIPYASNAAVEFGRELMKTLNDTALDESMRLAAEKGVYPAWETYEAKMGRPNPWPKARNSTRSSIAPTGTIAIIAGVWGSIEPYYALECSRVTYEGVQMEDGVPPWVKEKLNNFADFTPAIAAEIDWRWHVKHQAAFQEHTDLGVSKTINLPNSATVKDVSDAYRYMWEMGCKGGTIFRDGCRNEQVLTKRDTQSVYATKTTVVNVPPAVALIDPEDGTEYPTIRHKVHIEGVDIYLHIGLKENRPFEVFFRAGMGSTVDGMLDAFAKTFSTSLQRGVPLEKLVKLHKGSKFSPSGFTGKKKIQHCTSIVDYVVRLLELKFLGGEQKSEVVPDEKCPDCGGILLREGPCKNCKAAGCGYSKCG